MAGVAPTTRANQARVFLLNYTPSSLVPMAGFPPAFSRLEGGRLMCCSPRCPEGTRTAHPSLRSGLRHLCATRFVGHMEEMVPSRGLSPRTRASRARMMYLSPRREWGGRPVRTGTDSFTGCRADCYTTTTIETEIGAPCRNRTGLTALQGRHVASTLTERGRRGRTCTSTKHSSSATPAIRRVVLLYTTRR